MVTDTLNSPAAPKSFLHTRKAHLCALGAVIVMAVAIFFLNKYWPYRYRNVVPTLEKVFASQIKVDHYRRLYFPSPGFAADGLTLRRNSAPNLPPVGSIDHVRVVGRWSDLLLLRDRIQNVIH
jgi:hypothetical protein